MAESLQGFAPRDVMRLVFRRRNVFFLCASITIIVVLFGATRMSKEYTSTTKFERRRDAVAEQESAKSSESFEAIKRTLKQDIVSQRAVGDVIHELGLTQGLPRDRDGMLTPEGERRRDSMIRGIQQATTVKFEVTSTNVDLISVSFTSADPVLAEQVPNALVKNYIETVSSQIKKRLEESSTFLEDRLHKAEQRLQEVSNKKSKIEEEFVGITAETPGEIIARMQESRTNVDALQAQLLTLQKSLAKMESAQSEHRKDEEPVRVVMGPNPEIERLMLDLRKYQDRLEEAQVLLHMTDRHPDVKALKTSIRIVRARLQRTPKEIVLQKIYEGDQAAEVTGQQIAGLRAEIEHTQVRLTAAKSRMLGYENMLEKYRLGRKDYLPLLKEYQDRNIEVEDWKRRLRDVRDVLAAEAQNRRTRLRVTDRAKREYTPSSPNRLKLLGMAFGGGLAIGAGIVFLLSKFDRTVSVPEQAPMYFDTPVHGVISEIMTPARQRFRRIRQWIIEPVVAVILIAAIVISAYRMNLWLLHPEEYNKWEAAPVEYILQKVESNL